MAAWLAKRIGLINTMVYTHIPSSIFLILAAFSPNLYRRAGSAAGAFGAVANGRADAHILCDGGGDAGRAHGRRQLTAVPRSLASSISPAMTGALLATPFSGLPLIVCGVLKIVYDVALLYSFRHMKPPEERPD